MEKGIVANARLYKFQVRNGAKARRNGCIASLEKVRPQRGSNIA